MPICKYFHQLETSNSMPQQKPYNVTILKQRGLRAYDIIQHMNLCLEGYPPVVVEIMSPAWDVACP